jgi:hypothetical protein
MAGIQVKSTPIATPDGTANIYRLKRPRVTEQTVRTLAGQLGMRADPSFGRISSDADKLIFSEQHLELTVFRSSGAIRFIDRSRWQVDDRRSDLLIEDAAATRLATSLIRKNGLAPAGGNARFLKTSRLRIGTASREGHAVAERTIDVAVALQRMVDKTPVDGPGGKIVVYFDQEQRLSGIEKIWREIGSVHRHDQPHRPVEDAIQEMDVHFRAKRGSIEIEDVRYGYFEEGWKTQQQYLQPAYIIFGLFMSPNSNVRKRTIYVAPALAKPMGQLTPPLEQKPRQRPRREVRQA